MKLIKRGKKVRRTTKMKWKAREDKDKGSKKDKQKEKEREKKEKEVKTVYCFAHHWSCQQCAKPQMSYCSKKAAQSGYIMLLVFEVHLQCCIETTLRSY